jgi:homoserine O-acetyltransferase
LPQPAAFEPPSSGSQPASNPALSFPCLDVYVDRERKLAQQFQQRQPRQQQSPSIPVPGQASPPQTQQQRHAGPEPTYARIVSGYSTFHYPHAYRLVHGGYLPEFDIAYETWGRLNERRDNAILIHTGLSASSHAKSHERNRNPGWWEKFIGPGLPLDTIAGSAALNG